MAGHRFDQEVDGAQVIASLEVGGRGGITGEEDDRRGRQFLGSPDQLGGLEPVHPGEVDVEDDDGDPAPEQFGECVFTGTGRDDIAIQREEHGAQQVAQSGVIVDQQDGLRGVRAGSGAQSPVRSSLSPRSSSTCRTGSGTKTPTLAHFVSTSTPLQPARTAL